MKIIDNKGRLFEKVSIIDVLILVVVIAAVGFVYIFFVKGETQIQTSSDTQTVRYIAEIRDVNKALTEMPKVGEEVYNSSKNFYIGKVVAVEAQPNLEVKENTVDGSHDLFEQEDRYRVLITIEAEAAISDRYILVGSQYVRVGEKLPIKGKGYAGLSYIVAVELEGEDQ